MDLLKQYLEESIQEAKGRQIAVLGYGAFAAVAFCALKALGIDALCFYDMDRNRINGNYFGKDIRPLWELEDTGRIFVIDVFNDPDVMKKYAGMKRLQEGVHYSSLHGIFGYKKCDVADPLLVYNRTDDFMGFTVFGDDRPGEDTLKVVAMGGSTSDCTFGGIKSWPELLHEILSDMGIDNTVYGGGMVGYTSAQERDKFLRDVLPLRPDVVISLSGDNDIGWNHTDPDRNYYSSYLSRQIVEPVYRRCLEKGESIDYGLNTEMTDAERWFRNHKTAAAVADEFGIRYLCMLQPGIFSKSYRMSDFEKSWMDIIGGAWLSEHNTVSGLFAHYGDFHEHAGKLMAGDESFTDVSDIFSGMSGVFIDGIHCDEEGNRIIAGRAAEEILRMQRVKND